jgi:hypothetical protein
LLNASDRERQTEPFVDYFTQSLTVNQFLKRKDLAVGWGITSSIVVSRYATKPQLFAFGFIRPTPQTLAKAIIEDRNISGPMQFTGFRRRSTLRTSQGDGLYERYIKA